MSYNPSIPLADDLMSESQGQILTNFGQLNTIFDQDHVTYDDVTAVNRGKHNQSTYPDSSSDPNPALNELALYSKDVGGNSRLFLQQENSGTVIQLSGIDPLIAVAGFTFLPGGVLLQWGKEVSPGTSGTVTLPVAFPTTVFSINFGVIRTSSTSDQNVYVDDAFAIGLSDFHYTSTSSNNDFFWSAIGN